MLRGESEKLVGDDRRQLLRRESPCVAVGKAACTHKANYKDTSGHFAQLKGPRSSIYKLPEGCCMAFTCASKSFAGLESRSSL